jgi:LysM repeat protein
MGKIFLEFGSKTVKVSAAMSLNRKSREPSMSFEQQQRWNENAK